MSYYLVKQRTPKKGERFLISLLPGYLCDYKTTEVLSRSTISQLTYYEAECLYFNKGFMHYQKHHKNKHVFVQTTNDYARHVILHKSDKLLDLIKKPEYQDKNVFLVETDANLLISYFNTYGTFIIHGTIQSVMTGDLYHKRAIRFQFNKDDIYPLTSDESKKIPWMFIRGLSKQMRKSLDNISME